MLKMLTDLRKTSSMICEWWSN